MDAVAESELVVMLGTITEPILVFIAAIVHTSPHFVLWLSGISDIEWRSSVLASGEAVHWLPHQD